MAILLQSIQNTRRPSADIIMRPYVHLYTSTTLNLTWTWFMNFWTENWRASYVPTRTPALRNDCTYFALFNLLFLLLSGLEPVQDRWTDGRTI